MWVGVGLMGSGALGVGLGAAETDPCAGQSYCTSNYTTVRAVDFASGGIAAGVGLVLFLVGLGKKE